MKNKTKHIIKTIEPGSIAEELELEPGDELLRVNGEIIEDVFDYHFQTNDTYLELTIRKKDGEEWAYLAHSRQSCECLFQYFTLFSV